MTDSMMTKREERFVVDIDYFVYRKCTPTWNIGEDFLPVWDLTYVLSGSAHYTISGKEYILSAGDLFCMPPDNVRKAHTFPHKLMTCFAINFRLTTLTGEPSRLPFPLISHLGVRKDIVRLFHELSFTWLDRQPGYTIKAHGLFTLILHRLYELIVYKIDSEAGDFRVKKVMRYIAQHYMERISVKSMAAMIGLNPVYFGALFKQESGLSMSEYQARTRIRNAENMLRSGEYQVNEAAEHCGYCDVYHFYKQFKATMGIPPSACIPKRSD
ncbi:MAG: AraC family transcriptional regulator [Treponema sp.]|jgi:AraC-like DNA-binding protein|nr:AraC family transcriptional regulator [Treponema sp.]